MKYFSIIILYYKKKYKTSKKGEEKIMKKIRLEKELLILLEYAYSFSTYSSDVCAWTVFQDMLADL